ncbi:hypothetical protein DPMN_054604 [Dreissena polymorpha]|uniref:Uncharacterized protein n=1 Tax=Dreissena polymorpha TaxID=45954 RepID=A0A9D4CQW5_DREPO|nr:hypothetical protein DPMN_054604 [Dreissena polymorpha]
MHHHLPNQERAFTSLWQSSQCQGRVRFAVLSQIKPQVIPGGALPSIPLSFSFATILPPPGTQKLRFPGVFPRRHLSNHRGSTVGIICDQNYDGI